MNSPDERDRNAGAGRLEVIGVGFGRTGTDSTRAALNRLGFPCYHMFEVLENPNNRHHLDFWLEVSRSEPGDQHDWQRVFENYRATVDNPGACVWRELLAENPEAKVLLTVHPKGPEAWYRSTIQTIYAIQSSWHYRLLRGVIPRLRKTGEMTDRLIWRRFHQSTMDHPSAAIQRYEEHQREVREEVPADRLLVFRASDGWGPLCKFLGVPVPDEPFPRTNDSASFQRRLRKVRFVAYALVASMIVAGAILLWAAVG